MLISICLSEKNSFQAIILIKMDHSILFPVIAYNSSNYKKPLTEKQSIEANQISSNNSHRTFTDSSDEVQMPWRLTQDYRLGKIELRIIQNQIQKEKKQIKLKVANNNKYICRCGLKYRFISSFELHQKLRHPEGYYDSDQEICAEQCLQLLENSSTGSESISIKSYYSMYPINTVYSKRSEAHIQRKYYCELCSRSYKDYCGLYNHRLLEHNLKGGINKLHLLNSSNSNEKKQIKHKHSCFCGKSYQSSATLRMHQRMVHQNLIDGLPINPDGDGSYGNQRPKCGCGLTFNSYCSLAKHVSVKHKGNAPMGTWGGPASHLKVSRPNRIKEGSNGYKETKQDIKCSKCGEDNVIDYFWRCIKCVGHFVCRKCYQGINNDEDHQWIFSLVSQLKKKSQKANIKTICSICLMRCNRKYWECVSCQNQWKWCGNCQEGRESIHCMDHQIRIVAVQNKGLRVSITQ